MAAHKLSILVEALGTAEANSKLRGVDRTISKVGADAGKGMRTAVSNLASVAAVGAGAAIGGLALVLKQGTDALREDAVAAAQTAAVIKSTGGAAGVTASQVGDLATKMAMLNGVDDNVIQNGENVLLTFTKIGRGIFPEVTQAAVDMSAALGTDMQSAVLQLGKALQDPATGMTALRRSGVSLTAQQQAQIKTLAKHNDLLGAQRLILAEVRREFSGVAAAQADADPGKRLAVAWEEFEKTLASGVLPVVQDLQRKLTALLADPSVQARAKAFASQAGDALQSAARFAEQIPWDKVESGLGKAAGFAGDLVRAFTSMPPEVQAALIGIAGINKLSGGAVAAVGGDLLKGWLKDTLGINAAVVNVRGGVVNGGAGIASKAAGALGASGAGEAAAGTGLGAAGILAGVAGILAIPAFYNLVYALRDQSSPGASGASVTGSQGQSLGSLSWQQVGTAGVNVSNLLAAQGNMGAGPGRDTHEAMPPNWSVLPAGRDTHEEMAPTNALLASLRANGIDLAAIASRAAARLDSLHIDFERQMGILKSSKDPAAIVAAAVKAADDISRGVGSVATTQGTLATLRKDRAAVAASGDKGLLAKLDAAIAAVSGKIAPRQWVADQLAEARKVAASSETTKQKTADLARIEAELKRDGATQAASQVEAIRATTTAVGAQQPPTVNVDVTVPVSISAGGVQRTSAVAARWGRLNGSFGGARNAGGVAT